MALPNKDPNKDPKAPDAAPTAGPVVPAAVPGSVPTAAATLVAPDQLPTQVVRAPPEQMPTQIVHPTLMQKIAAGPQAFGGLPNAPAPGSATAMSDQYALTHPGNVFGIPTGNDTHNPYAEQANATPVQPGQVTLGSNQPSAGTVFGRSLLDARKGVANTDASLLNAGMTAGAGITNAATYLPRVVGGFARDVARSVVGASESPNAGQPLGGMNPPQIKQPYQKPAINFSVTDLPPSATVSTGSMGGPATPAAVADARNYSPVADNISQANLAAASRMGTPDNGGPTGGPSLTAPGINTGVKIGSRSLPVGAMVNGVPTFSDGSGTGGIARTMTDNQIKHYGDNLSRADTGALGNVMASDVTGGPVSTNQMVAQRAAQLQQPITGSRPDAKQFADADRLAIAQMDPRSAAGIAARNLSMEAQYGGTGRVRQAAAASLANLQGGSQQSGLADQQAEAQAANTAAVGQNSLQAIQMQGQNELANTTLEMAGKLRMPQAGQQVQLADGTLGIQNTTTGQITPSLLPDGTAAKGQAKNPPAPIYTSAGGAASLKSLTDNILGVDPISGLITDKNAPGGRRMPSNEETYAAMQKAQGQLKALSDGQAGNQSAGPPATVISYLKQNPSAAAQFDERYGAGSAAKVLGK